MLTENSLRSCKLASLADCVITIGLSHVSLGEGECYVEQKPSSGVSCKEKQVSCAVTLYQPVLLGLSFSSCLCLPSP